MASELLTDRIQEQFKNLESELSNLQGLFEGSQATDGNHNWSKEALAQLGLLAQQYELTQYQIQKYNDELNQLSSDYLSGKYSATEYADKLADLSSAQWESVKSSEAIKDAIIDLNEARFPVPFLLLPVAPPVASFWRWQRPYRHFA